MKWDKLPTFTSTGELIPDFWLSSNSVSAKVDLKVRLGRSNSKMVVYWEVRPVSRAGSVG